MQQKTFEFIRDNIDTLDIDMENGVIHDIKHFIDDRGYVVFNLNGKLVRAHQVISVKAFGENCIGLHINHIDGNPSNNSLINLELVTRSENMKHAYRKGGAKSRKGEPNKKLNEDDVRDIKSRLAKGQTHASISRDYPVSNRQITNIARGLCWKHVK